MTNRKFASGVLYFGMVTFIAFPIVKLVQGVVLEMHVIFLSLALGMAFGFFATRQVMKSEEEKELILKDRTLKMHCPKCDAELVELTSPIDDFVLNSYKGLIYCKVCDFELPKNEFDKKYGRLKNG